jgi:hypothetical protein
LVTLFCAEEPSNARIDPRQPSRTAADRHDDHRTAPPGPYIQQQQHRYRSPRGFTSWSGHWAKAVAVELPFEQSESIADDEGIRGAKTCPWARATDAEPRFLSPALAQAFLQTEQLTS